MVVNRQELLDSLHIIIQLLSSKEFSRLYESNSVGKYNIDQRVKAVHYRLLSLDSTVPYEFRILPNDLIAEWRNFGIKYGYEPTQVAKISFGELIKKTIQFFEYLRSLPTPSKQKPINAVLTESQEGQKSVRTMNGEQLQSDLSRLNEFLSIATQKLENAKKHGEPNEEEIEKLDTIIKEYQQRIRKLREDKEAHENDMKSEQEWAKRLSESFEGLKKESSCLKFDIWVARAEFFGFIALMAFATVWFVCWFNGFYSALTAKDSSIHINSWISYLPYALPVTAYIAMMWIFTVQKNRASKMSVSLSMRLSNIHYLEGLLKLVNRLSIDSEVAVERINKIVEKMVDSYLRQIEINNITEKKIENIEEKEEKEAPHQRIIDKLRAITS